MLYFVIECQATSWGRSVDGKKEVILPSFSITYLPNNQEIVPIFLTRLHAYIYLKAANSLNEFKIVSIENLELNVYRNIFKEEANKNSFPYEFKLVVGFSSKDTQCHTVFFNKSFQAYEIFAKVCNLENEIAAMLGKELYNNISNTDKTNDNDIMEIGNEIIDITVPKKKYASKVISTIKNIFYKESNKPETEYKPHQDVNLGTMRLFILKHADGSAYAPPGKDGYPSILLFVNKLDATIFLLMLKQRDYVNYEIVAFNSDQYYFSKLKNYYEAGAIKLAVVLGFLAFYSPLGNKWAKTDDSMQTPAMSIVPCTWEEIKNGYDLAIYLNYIQGEQELKRAIEGIINTNLTSTSHLIEIAKKTVEDMQTNIVVIDENNPYLYPRLMFLSK